MAISSAQLESASRSSDLPRSDFTSLLGRAPLVLVPILLAGGSLACNAPQWALMLAIATGLLLGFKWLTYWNWRSEGHRSATSTARQLGYLLLWPGMNADEFFDPVPPSARPQIQDWLAAIAKICFGAILLFVVAPRIVATLWYVKGWVALVGLGFLVHFGGFHLLALLWQSSGVHATPIMNWPLASASVTEFWGRRWNRAFRDLAHPFVLHPLAPRIGAERAMLAVFAVSALLHELAISVPAYGGYGLPTVYFAIQAAGMLAEHGSAVGTTGEEAESPAECSPGPLFVLPLRSCFTPPSSEPAYYRC